MGAGALAQLSAACLGWRQANLSIGPEHREAQMVGEDPVKALVVWWKKKKKKILKFDFKHASGEILTSCSDYMGV